MVFLLGLLREDAVLPASAGLPDSVPSGACAARRGPSWQERTGDRYTDLQMGLGKIEGPVNGIPPISIYHHYLLLMGQTSPSIDQPMAIWDIHGLGSRK